MNIKNVKKTTLSTFQDIFVRQKELFLKYSEIEGKNGIGLGLLKELQGSIDDPVRQYVLKDRAWRITEEVAEALECVDFDEIHCQEEIIDGLHFLVELFLVAGLDYEYLLEHSELLKPLFNQETLYLYLDLNAAVTRFIRDLGCAMNCLKLKPWKNTHVPTDEVKFIKMLGDAFKSYCILCRAMGLSGEKVVEIYDKKSQVNKFRQKSNY